MLITFLYYFLFSCRVEYVFGCISLRLVGRFLRKVVVLHTTKTVFIFLLIFWKGALILNERIWFSLMRFIKNIYEHTLFQQQSYLTQQQKQTKRIWIHKASCNNYFTHYKNHLFLRHSKWCLHSKHVNLQINLNPKITNLHPSSCIWYIFHHQKNPPIFTFACWILQAIMCEKTNSSLEQPVSNLWSFFYLRVAPHKSLNFSI